MMDWRVEASVDRCFHRRAVPGGPAVAPGGRGSTGAVPGLPAAVVCRGPGPGRDFADCLGDVVCDRHADRVGSDLPRADECEAGSAVYDKRAAFWAAVETEVISGYAPRFIMGSPCARPAERTLPMDVVHGPDNECIPLGPGSSRLNRGGRLRLRLRCAQAARRGRRLRTAP